MPLVSHNCYDYDKSSLMRSESILPKKRLSLRSSTIVDVRALPGVDCSRLDIVAQLHRKDNHIY